jgi:hypothetical protein
MKIKFLRVCEAPQQYTPISDDPAYCPGTEWEPAWFEPGEEADPEEWDRKIDLSGLKFRVDYDIVEYP